ncbi:MAG: Maf family protein [Roseburia sp.]|nr:Maf family protein [Roseburia sp.]MCM1277664.1 Maf family protein [Robinsoniella sp.]
MLQKHFILASNSPRRRELLQQAGVPFTVMPSKINEVITKAEPEEIVQELSAQKAEDVFQGLEDGEKETSIVLGADTVVACEGVMEGACMEGKEKGDAGLQILGKPKNQEEAFCMLKKLQGKSHLVYTGVTLVWQEKGKIERESFAAETKVVFYPMTDEEIRTYIETKEPMDKAGAYGIQGKGAIYIKEIQGDYNNVVGLPLGALYQRMKEIFIN